MNVRQSIPQPRKSQAQLAIASRNVGRVEMLERRCLLSASFAVNNDTSAPAQLDVALGDIDGDGHVDAVGGGGAQLGSTAVNVFFNGGDGTFTAPTVLTGEQQPFGSALGDFNRDGKLDVVTSNFGSNTLNVYLNTGNRTFAAPATYAVGSSPSGVQTADVNGDGKLDLIVAQRGSNSVGVLLGNGDGTFAPVVTYASAAETDNVRVADLNGDGHPDIVAEGFYNGGSLTVLLNNGDGTFRTLQSFSDGVSGAVGIAVADMNSDGIPDLLVANGTGNSVSLLNGVGDGTFATPITLAAGNNVRAVTVADFNGDGNQDIAVSNYDDQTVGIFLNSGGENFAAMQTVAIAGHGYDIQTADLNNDGKPDLLTSNYVGSAAGLSALINQYATSPTITQSNGTVIVTGTTSNDTGSATVSNGNLTVTLGSATQTFALSSIHGLTISLGAGNDVFRVGNFVPPVTVVGGAGADTIVGNNQGDLLNGGRGRDLIVAKKKNTIIHGGRGADTLTTSSTADDLLGGRGSDLFVNGGGSSDTLDGGTGLNFAQANTADTLLNIFENYDNAGLTSPAPQAAIAPADAGGVSQAVVGTNLIVTGSPNADNIDVTLDGNGSLNVTNNAQPVGTVPLAGLTGIIVKGGAGNDTIVVNTFITLPTTLRGGAGNDTLAGGGGNNVLVGGAGNDSLVGGPAGTSLLVPGSRLAFTNAPTGNDSLDGGGGITIADFSHRTDNLHLSNDGRADSGGSGETTTIATNVTEIFSGAGNDTIVATTPGMFLSGGAGNDTITAAGAASVLVGGVGADTVAAASSGQDALYLVDGQADTSTNTISSDILQIDPTLDT